MIYRAGTRMPRWRVDWPNRPLIKRLQLNYWVQRHLIPPVKFPCTLTYITSSRILLSILEDSQPPESCPSLMCCCFASCRVLPQLHYGTPTIHPGVRDPRHSAMPEGDSQLVQLPCRQARFKTLLLLYLGASFWRPVVKKVAISSGSLVQPLF